MADEQVERDQTPVKVKLEIKRLYRAKDEDKDAIEVGPGDVIVPAWVAKEWGLEAKPEPKAPAVPKKS